MKEAVKFRTRVGCTRCPILWPFKCFSNSNASIFSKRKTPTSPQSVPSWCTGLVSLTLIKIAACIQRYFVLVLSIPSLWKAPVADWLISVKTRVKSATFSRSWHRTIHRSKYKAIGNKSPPTKRSLTSSSQGWTSSRRRPIWMKHGRFNKMLFP